MSSWTCGALDTFWGKNLAGALQREGMGDVLMIEGFLRVSSTSTRGRLAVSRG